MALQDYSKRHQLREPADSAPSEVWYALDRDGRPVVVKLLKSRLAADVQRFLHEIDCAERLVSPNFAQVWESGMEPVPYIVFEYIDGKNLAKVAPIRNLWEYLRTAEAIVAGLAAIHEQGIAHRDITPENILYERDGHAKIVDLGIALTNRDRQTVSPPPGTAGWIAPERRQGRLLELAEEQKSDIFSTGLLLSYLRTGIHPFGHDQRRIDSVTEQPDLARVDEHLCDLLRKALDRDPARRPEAKELLRELLRLARRVPASPRRGMGRIGRFARKYVRSYRKRIAIVAVLLLVVLALVVTPWGRLAPSFATVCPVGLWNNSGDAVLRFGALLPASGPLAAMEPQQSAAVELAINDVRSGGGVPGIQIVGLGVNKVDEGNPVLGTACESTSILLENGVDVIIGPSSSAVTRKIIDKVTTANTILFSPANTAPEFTDYKDHGLYFRTAASDVLQGRVLGKVVSAEGNKNALVISRDDAYGNGLSQEVERSLGLNYVDLLPAVKYDPQATDFGPLVESVESRNPDAIVLIGFDETARILATLLRAGITPQSKKIYGTEGNMLETLPGQVVPPKRDVLNGMRGTTRLINPDFAKLLNQSLGGGLVEFTYAAEAYDGVIVSTLAAASAHSDIPTNIAKKINEVTEGGEKCTTYASCIEKIKQGIDVDYDGVSGPLEFNDAGEPCVASYLVVEFNGNGSLVPVRPVEASSLCIKLR